MEWAQVFVQQRLPLSFADLPTFLCVAEEVDKMCSIYLKTFFFVSFSFPTLSLKLCLVSISAFHLQSTHKRMWAGLQKKVRLDAVQNYEPNTWFGDFCTIK